MFIINSPITLKNKCDDIELINYNYKLNSLRPSVKMILDEITDENKNIKENISIILLLYFLGAISGILIELINLIK